MIFFAEELKRLSRRVRTVLVVCILLEVFLSTTVNAHSLYKVLCFIAEKMEFIEHILNQIL